MGGPHILSQVRFEPSPCRCCGMVPLWFGDATWCLCEPAPRRSIVCGADHECTFERRLHHHWFGRLIAEGDEHGSRAGVVFTCACGQARRIKSATRASAS